MAGNCDQGLSELALENYAPKNDMVAQARFRWDPSPGARTQVVGPFPGAEGQWYRNEKRKIGRQPRPIDPEPGNYQRLLGVGEGGVLPDPSLQTHSLE